ncbi:MAG: response regulator [Gammaproteobacteria bacterium]|nr:response regulator [Gammaproteobacteria bacterium]
MTLTHNELMVLLVEPSKVQRRIIEGYLNNLGVTHHSVATSGKDAMEKMTTYQPDLVISTLYLPDMTGTDLVYSMRDDENLADTAFMLISSETRLHFLDPIRQAGAIAILPKPFSQNDLKIALNNTVDLLDAGQIDIDNLELENLEILIVDDSRFARKHICRVLSDMGLERFTEAENGDEAVALIENNFYDLIVTDYNMPEMDGKELIEHIRSKSSQAAIPVMMVTSESNENRLAAVQQAGVSAICDKPFEPDTVRRLIEQILS